jgi:hypothetical protein
MARKSRKSPASPLLIGGMLFALVAVLAVAAFLSGKAEPFRTVPPLDVAVYMENANSLRGNTYQLRGEVLNSLAFSPTSGRLISVSTEDNRVLPLIIPAKFNQTNIQRGQRLVFLLEVDSRGILQVSELSKS